MTSQHRQPLMNEEVREHIKGTFVSFSLGPKKDRLISGVVGIGLFALMVFLFDAAGGSRLPRSWNFILLAWLLVLTVIWNTLAAIFWKPPSPEELQFPIAETSLPRLHHAEAWASLWFGVELLLLSFLGMALSLLFWNAFVLWGPLNLVPLGFYGFLYPILLWRRHWLLRIGVAFGFNLLSIVWPLSLIVVLMSILAPLIRSASVDFRFWVLNGAGAVSYAFTCLAVGAAFRLFGVARIHFQAYKKLEHGTQ
jgi:hypothetical protein